jgi:hypothetical protein
VVTAAGVLLLLLLLTSHGSSRVRDRAADCI